MPADEDHLPDPVGLRVLEDRPRPAEVDPVMLFARRGERGDGRHVHHAVGLLLAEHVLGRALAQVDLVHFDALRRIPPGALVDADHLVAVLLQRQRERPPEAAGDAHDQHLHATPASECLRRCRDFRPSSISSAMRDFTCST